jgi:rhodanese-related sulfurtransferase
VNRLEVQVSEAAPASKDGATVIDVREPWEFAAGHVPGAVLMPLGSLSQHAGDLPRGRRIYVICASGNRSLVAADALVRAGFDAVSVAGGMAAWRSAGQPVVAGSQAA